MTDTTDKLTLQQLKDVRELCLPHTAWRLIIDELISARDRLEAERQRADRYNFVAMSALETQAEISEQLGINEDECDGSPEQVHEKIEMLQKEIAALKAKLANPVVLPEAYEARMGGNYEIELVGTPNGEVYTVEDVQAAIRAAGFMVQK